MNIGEWWDNLRFDIVLFGAAGSITGFALKPTRKFAPAFVQVFGGLCAAVAGTPLITLWWEIPNQQVYAGVAFLIGVSGLSIIKAIPKVVPPLFFKMLEFALSFRKDDPR